MTRYARPCYRPGCHFVANSQADWHRHKARHAADDRADGDHRAAIDRLINLHGGDAA